MKTKTNAQTFECEFVCLSSVVQYICVHSVQLINTAKRKRNAERDRVSERGDTQKKHINRVHFIDKHSEFIFVIFNFIFPLYVCRLCVCMRFFYSQLSYYFILSIHNLKLFAWIHEENIRMSQSQYTF